MATQLDDLKTVLERIEKLLEKRGEKKEQAEAQTGKGLSGVFKAVFDLAKSLPRLLSGDLGVFKDLPHKLLGVVGAALSTDAKKTKKKAAGGTTAATEEESTQTDDQNIFSRVLSSTRSAMSSLFNAGKSIFSAGKNLVKGKKPAAPTEVHGTGAGNIPITEPGAEAAAEAATGGAEVAAVGGEAAAEGGVAALASNPVGWVLAAVAGVVAVTVALASIPAVVASMTDSLLASQRKFAEASGALAEVMAKSDVFDILRNQKIGNALAPSAARLEQSREELLTKLTPYIVGIYDILNSTVASLANTVSFFVGWAEGLTALERAALAIISPIGASIIEVLRAIRPAMPEEERGTATSGWLDVAATEYDRRIRAGEVLPEVRIRR